MRANTLRRPVRRVRHDVDDLLGRSSDVFIGLEISSTRTYQFLAGFRKGEDGGRASDQVLPARLVRHAFFSTAFRWRTARRSTGIAAIAAGLGARHAAHGLPCAAMMLVGLASSLRRAFHLWTPTSIRARRGRWWGCPRAKGRSLAVLLRITFCGFR